MRYKEIFEGRDAPLYHGTSLFHAAAILNDNVFKANTAHDNKRLAGLGGSPGFGGVHGISLTRDYQKGLDFGDVVFEIDQRKLSQTNKIIPFDFWAANLTSPSYRGQNTTGGDTHEFEEFCVGDIKPATKYIKTIYMRQNRYNFYKRFPENIALLKTLTDDSRFKLIENNRKPLFSEDEIFLESELPQVASNQEVKDLCKSIHYSLEDFNEGNISHRINRYSDYILKRIHLSKSGLSMAASSLGWHDRDNKDVIEFSKMDSKTTPPIVYDRLDKQVIDGAHRIAAALLRGDKTILAYVGYHVDPNWASDEIEEEFNPKTDPTIMSATKKDGNISRKAADKMVDPRNNLAKPKYFYKKP